MLRNLIEYGIDTLPRTHNLTDGHAFRRWSAPKKQSLTGRHSFSEPVRTNVRVNPGPL
jgi:hypothetical protein